MGMINPFWVPVFFYAANGINLKFSKSRKWQLTINNPADKGITHETIKTAFKVFRPHLLHLKRGHFGNVTILFETSVLLIEHSLC